MFYLKYHKNDYKFRELDQYTIKEACGMSLINLMESNIPLAPDYFAAFADKAFWGKTMDQSSEVLKSC